jgi:hypothetical protein
MHGVAAPYAQAVLGRELGCGPSCFLHPDSQPDFGGLHPDPNLAYASDLVKAMGLLPSGAPDAEVGGAGALPDLGAAADGDADRNMILGKQVCVCVFFGGGGRVGGGRFVIIQYSSIRRAPLSAHCPCTHTHTDTRTYSHSSS